MRQCVFPLRPGPCDSLLSDRSHAGFGMDETARRALVGQHRVVSNPPEPDSTHASAARCRASLLVMPGWDDKGKDQYHALDTVLSAEGWKCRRANLPDADWTEEARRRVTRDDTLRQAVSDHAQLASECAASSPMAWLGFSYGGYVAALMTQQHKPRWLVLRSPSLYPDDDWQLPKEELDQRDFSAWRRRDHVPHGNRALRCCSKFGGDVLLIDSERDLVIPRQVIGSYARAFIQARSLTRYTLAKADHALSDPQWQREYHDVVVKWLQQKLQQ
jgi:pimeloyl-ACP methyl ester carboxylesterase